MGELKLTLGDSDHLVLQLLDVDPIHAGLETSLQPAGNHWLPKEVCIHENCWQVFAGSCKLKLVPVSNRILKLVVYFTGSQCKKLRMSEI